MKIINLTKNTIIADKVTVAACLKARTIGLLNRGHLDKGEALILRPCNSIHTFFMRFPIDVIFVNKHNRAVKIISNLKPFRITGIYPALYTIELAIGAIQTSLTQVGDSISIE